MSNNLNIADPSIEFKVPLETDNIFEVFHCGGLLLFTTKGDRPVVWNPCLGETRWIQIKNDNERFSRFSLGYENNKFCHSYKILRYDLQKQDDKLVGFQIYDFSSDSWRVLDVVALDCTIALYGASLKGNAYWLACDETDYSEEFLLSFDFTRERFRRLCLPMFQNCGPMNLSVAREEQLSVLHRSNGTSKMDMWVTNKIDIEAAVWSKYFTVDIHIHGYFPNIPRIFLIDDEKKVVVCCYPSGNMEYSITKYYT